MSSEGHVSFRKELVLLKHVVGEFHQGFNEMLVLRWSLYFAVKPMLRYTVEMVQFFVQIEQLLECADLVASDDDAFCQKADHF